MLHWSMLITYYFRYFRLAYNLIVVSVCSLLYRHCILTIRNSRVNKRGKLLTFAFIGNLVGWLVTVLPHLIYLDFFLDGDQIMLPTFFYWKHFQHYLTNVSDGQQIYDKQTIKSAGCFYKLMK